MLKRYSLLSSDACAGITSIIYKCNLNYNTALKTIDELLRKEYIKVELNDKKREYLVTERGESFLETLATLEI